MKKWISAVLAFSFPALAEQAAGKSELFFSSNYDRYLLKANDALETDKDGSGYSLAIGGNLNIGKGYLHYGIGIRGAKASGENYDRSQEVEVSDILLKLGYLYPVPALERYFRAGLISEVSRGKGSSLGYEAAESTQTVARLAPAVQLHIPMNERWRPYLEASHSWDMNNQFYREMRSSFGVGILLELGATESESAKPASEPEPTPSPTPTATPEPAPQLTEESIQVGSGLMIFALGEADLQTPLHGYASDLAETLKKESDAWTRMSIIGFAETSESELHGSDLSEKRARTVRDFLLAQGLPEERLSVAAPDANSSQTLSQQRVDLLLFGSSLDKLKGIATRISEKHSTDTLSLRLEVLTMDKSKVEVGSKGRTFLIALGKLLKAHDDQWQSLIVKGFTDTRGSADVNHRVARQRGETQAAILINEGLSADRIKSMGIVTSILLDPQDPTSHWNRRAEIEIYGVKDAKELKAQIEALGGS